MFSGILLFLVIIAVLFYVFFYFAEKLQAPSLPGDSSGSVCIKERCFFVELAKTDAERGKGLMYRNELDKNKGMLFIFDKEAIYPFWMKNTLIPLDMIWADSNGKVVFISQNVQPCKSLICPSVMPSAKAKYVLEINAGIAEENGLKLGDELKLNIQ
jgi:uncharacterized membrane protein (UPF0127 family)